MHLISFMVCQILRFDKENKFRWMVTGITGKQKYFVGICYSSVITVVSN